MSSSEFLLPPPVSEAEKAIRIPRHLDLTALLPKGNPLDPEFKSAITVVTQVATEFHLDITHPQPLEPTLTSPDQK